MEGDTIVPKNYLIKGRKYLMFVNIRKIGYVDGTI